LAQAQDTTTTQTQRLDAKILLNAGCMSTRHNYDADAKTRRKNSFKCRMHGHDVTLEYINIIRESA